MYFSANNLSFYPEQLKIVYQDAGSWPADVVKLTDEEVKLFVNKTPESDKVLSSKDNRPVWIDTPKPELTANEIAAKARKYRNSFLAATDPLMISDYTINNEPLTDIQRQDLILTRLAFKNWPTQKNWPQIELPEIPYWLLIEAVNHGYIVRDWPKSNTN